MSYSGWSFDGVTRGFAAFGTPAGLFVAVYPWFAAVPDAHTLVLLLTSIIGGAITTSGVYCLLSYTDFDDQRIVGGFPGFHQSVAWSEVSHASVQHVPKTSSVELTVVTLSGRSYRFRAPSKIAFLHFLSLQRRFQKKPNKAPEPTTMAVTIRAPSSTARASHGRGSS